MKTTLITLALLTLPLAAPVHAMTLAAGFADPAQNDEIARRSHHCDTPAQQVLPRCRGA